MGILNNIVNIIKGIDFEEPIIVKESNGASKQLLEMTSFRNELNAEGQELIDDEIRLIQAGIYGEDSILYELKNSHLPIVVLRDLQLSFKELKLGSLEKTPFTSPAFTKGDTVILGNVSIIGVWVTLVSI